MLMVDTYKKEFLIYCYDEDLNRSEKVSGTLKKNDFNALVFNSRGLFLEAIEQSLPHIIFLYYQPLNLKFHDLLKRIRKVSAEVEIVILGSNDFWPGIQSLIKNGLADDFWNWPAADLEVLKLRLERVIEKTIFKYLAEQQGDKVEHIVKRLEELKPQDGFLPRAVNETHDILNMLTLKQGSEANIIEDLITQLKNSFTSSEFVYLKSYPSRNQLLVLRTSFSGQNYFRGEGIPFSQEQLKLDSSQCLNNLRNTLVDTFNCEDFVIQPVELADDFYGFIMAVNFQSMAYLQRTAKYLGITLRNNRLESSDAKPDMDKDLELEVTARQFPLVLSREISRARRLKQPVSIIIAHMEFVNESETEIENAIDLIKRNLRSYDVICKLPDQRLAILLPHCEYEDSAIKAETLRRQLVARGLKTQNTPLRLCFGVSEFPSLSSDSDSLIEDAKNACAQVLVSGKNKVCLYTAKEGFQPEFTL